MMRCPLLKVSTIVSGEIFVLPLLKRVRVLEIMKCNGNLLQTKLGFAPQSYFSRIPK